MIKQRRIDQALIFIEKAYLRDLPNFDYFKFYIRLLMDNDKHQKAKEVIESRSEFKEKEEITYLYNDIIETLERNV